MMDWCWSAMTMCGFRPKSSRAESHGAIAAS
jgi:hypothetical protein